MDNQAKHLLTNWVYWAGNPSPSVSRKSLVLLGQDDHHKDLIAKAIGLKLNRELATFPLHVPTDGEMMTLKSKVVILKEAIPQDDPVRPFYDAMTIKMPSVFKKVEAKLGTNLGVYGLHEIPLVIFAKDCAEVPQDVLDYHSVIVDATLAPSYYLGNTIAQNIEKIALDLRSDGERAQEEQALRGRRELRTGAMGVTEYLKIGYFAMHNEELAKKYLPIVQETYPDARHFNVGICDYIAIGSQMERLESDLERELDKAKKRVDDLTSALDEIRSIRQREMGLLQ